MPVVPIEDDMVRHHIGVQRLASGTVGKTDALMEQLGARLRSILAIHAAALAPPSKSKLAALLDAMKRATHEAYAEIEEVVLEELLAFADYEGEFQSRLLTQRFGLPVRPPKPARLKAIVNSPIGKRKAQGRLPAFDGVTVKQILRDQEARLNKMLKRSVMLAATAAVTKAKA